MFGIQKKSKPKQADNTQGGMIQGKGTGTSDDIKKNVDSGSYIMPADSTQQIGAQNLEGMGQQKNVNLSNGEFQLTPDQVHSVGVQTLDQMKGATHTPVDQPQLGIKPGQEKPELFFANGGLVSAYPSADDIRKARRGTNVPSTAHAQEFLGGQSQQQTGGPQARASQTFDGQARTVNPPPSTAHAQEFVGRQAASQQGGALQPRMGQTYDGQARSASNLPATTSAPAAAGGGANGSSFLSRAGGKALGAAKGLGIFHGIGSMVGGAIDGFNTSTEDYATRMGLDPNAERGALAETGIRTAGVLSDVGNAATLGLLGNRFPDKQRAAAEQGLLDQQARYAAHNAAKNKQQAPMEAQAAPQPSFNDSINNQMYGNPAMPQIQAAAPQSSDPYAVQQKGNSFSYSNPNAANQARAQGVPELQSSGFVGGIRPANDPRGVQNFMANTREMGPSQEQINRALSGLNNGQRNQGIAYPDRPMRNEQQEAERRNVMQTIQAPIKGARGTTSSQRAQLLDLQNGEDSRATTMYNTDANNATSQLNNSTNNTSAIAQTMMREQGSNDRAVLGENGQNSRYSMGLEQDAAKFNADYGLKSREANLNETKEGFGIRNSQRVEKLYEMYDKAETDEQRASIQERINRFTGAKGESGKDRYMTVGGGQEYNKEEGVMINRPQQIFDTKTGKLQNMDGSMASNNTVNDADFDKRKLENGAVYQSPDGKYFRWDAKTQKPIPVQQ